MDANTKEVLLALLPLIGSIVSATIAAWVAVRMAYITRVVNQQSDNIQKIETATNSMKDQLVAATASSSRAQGQADERQAQLERAGQQALGAMRASAQPPPPPPRPAAPPRALGAAPAAPGDVIGHIVAPDPAEEEPR